MVEAKVCAFVAKHDRGGVGTRATVTNNARIGRVLSMGLVMKTFEFGLVFATSNVKKHEIASVPLRIAVARSYC
ncbi:hypothetical protein ACFX2A_041374 [Malus domestica]